MTGEGEGAMREKDRLIEQALVLFAAITLMNGKIGTPQAHRAVQRWMRQARKVVKPR